MIRPALAAVFASALAAGALASVSTPATAADAVCPAVPATTPFAQASGVVSDGSGPVAGAAVYAINMESGGTACVLTSASGSYTVALPAVGSGGSARKPVDNWYIIANPSGTSALASALRVVNSTGVASGSTVSGQNLTMQTSNLQVTVTLDGTEDAIEGPAIACLTAERTLQPQVTCGVTQSFGGQYRAQLRVPATGRYWAQAAYVLPSGWAEGYLDSPIITAGSASSVDVTVAPQGSQPCPAGQVTMSGTVTQSQGGAQLPARAVISVMASWDSGNDNLGWADSGRNGDYQVCLDPTRLPPGLSLAGADLTVILEPFTGGVSSTFPLTSCGSGCVRDYSITGSPVVSGQVRLDDDTPAAQAYWTVFEVEMTSDGPQPSSVAAFGSTNSSGTWGVHGLSPGSYMVQVSPPPGARGYTSDDSMINVPGPETVNLSLPRGNITIQATNPDGSPASWTWVEARKCVSGQCDFRGSEADPDGYASLALDNGTWSITVYPPLGTTSVVANSAQVVVSGGLPTTWNSGAMPSSPTIQLRTPNVNFKVVRPTGSDDTIVPGSGIQLTPWSGGGNDPWNWEASIWANTDDSGLAPLWLDGGGTVYQLRVDPPSTVAVPVLQMYVVADGEGADVTLRSCEPPDDWRTQPCQPGDDSTAIPTSGAPWVLEFGEANIAGSVVDPQEDPQPYAGIQIARWTTDSWGNSYYQQLMGSAGWANANQNGDFALDLSQPGDYRLTAQKPWNSSEAWANGEYFFTVASGNICQRANSSTPCTPTGRLVGGSAVELSLVRPNVTGSVRKVSGGLLNGGYINVSRAEPCEGGGTGCQEFITGAEISQQGTFSLNLASDDDTYFLQVYPWNVDDTSVETTFELKVGPGQTFLDGAALQYTLRGSNVTGSVSTASGAPAPYSWVGVEKRLGPNSWQWVQGGASTNEAGSFSMYLPPGNYRLRVEPGASLRAEATTTIVPAGDDTYITVGSSGSLELAIELGEPNVSGTVTLPGDGGVAANAWIEVQRWNSTFARYEWTSDVPGTSAGSDGGYALDLPDGRWQINANPPWGISGASRNQLRVIVSGGGSSVCEDNGSGSCGPGIEPGGADIQLRSPNVSGTVVLPGGDPAGNTWIDVRGWNSSRNQYEWSEDLQGLNVNSLGEFAANLPDGRFQLAANPPYGNDSVSRGSVEIVIDEVVTSIDDSTCPSGGCPSIEIALSQPNMSGQVKTPSNDPVAFTQVYAEKWNESGQYWQWQEVWSNSSSSGGYALNLLNEGSYRVSARPTPDTAQYATGRKFVVVESPGDMCIVAGEALAKVTSTCASNDDSLPGTDIVLESANLPGRVSDASDPVENSWIGLLKKTAFGYAWVDGTNSSQDGGFAFNIDDTAEYRLDVSPPWGSSQGFARRQIDVVAFAQGGSVAVCPKDQWSGSCPASAVLGDDTPLDIVLSAGNLRGTVKTPLSDNQPVPDTGVSLEKWIESPWNPGSGQYTWQWTDLWTNTNATGDFSINVEDTGIFRLTGFPAWNDDSGYAKGTRVLRIDNSGAWCAVDDSTGTSADPFGTCPGGSYSNASSRLTVRLLEANVMTTVRSPGGDGVRDAWVGLRQKKNSGSYDYWVWLGGSSTRANGSFATFIDDSGTYALDVNPPWQSSEDLPRFTVEFSVDCTSNPCTSDLDDSIAFPAPNMLGKVVSPDDSTVAIANSWVSVEREFAPGDFRWTDLGASTNSQGDFVMSLPTDDTYRLTANPSWENPVGSRTSVTVVVSAGVATCTSGCLSDNRIQLLSPNLTGTVVDGATAMAYSWVEVRDGSGDWITGTGTDASGRFALNVTGGATYTVWAYPNWNLSRKPPKSASITVPVSGPATPATIDLGAVTPNFTLYVSDDSGATGSFLVAVERWNGSSWESMPNFTTTSDGASGDNNKALFALPNDTYRFTVVPTVGRTIAAGQNSAQAVVPTDSSAMVTFQESP